MQGDEAKYIGYALQGPFEEKLFGKATAVYKGIYKDGLRDTWGKMVYFTKYRDSKMEPTWKPNSKMEKYMENY